MPSPANRLRLLLVIPHLGGGGAEQVTSHLAQSLSNTLFETHLATLTPDRPGARTPPEWVHRHAIGAPRVRAAAWPLLKLIRCLRPNLLLSNMAHLNQLVLLLRPLIPRETRILIRQNTTVDTASLPARDRAAYRLLYPRADAILCQTQPMANALTREFAIPEAKLAVLPNPIDIESIRSQLASHFVSTPQASGPALLAVGRLSPEKGHALLLHAFVAVKEHHPAATQTILGEGPERENLKILIAQLGLETSVTLPGYAASPCLHFPSTTLFVHPSLHEGLPNALLEAAAAGLPIAATPSCPGLVSLLDNQPGTWLSRDRSHPALTSTILEALNQLHTSNQPALPRFEHPFLAPFALPAAIAAYEQLLLQVAAAPPALIPSPAQ